MKFKSIASRIFILVIPTILIAIISFSVLSYYVSDSQINKAFNEKMHKSLQVADLEIQMELYKNAAVALNFAHYGKKMDINTFDHNEHKNYLAEIIKSNKNTFGGGIWFEPYAFDSSLYYFGPFLYVDDHGEVFYAYEYAEYADYFNEDWYIKGKNSGGKLAWSKVYYDPFSTITMVTVSKAFYNGDGNFIGMGTADMNLENIRKIVNDISVGETGRAFILGSNGEYISFFDGEKNVDNTIQTDTDKALAQLGDEIMKNDSGITTLVRNGKKYRVYYTTMNNVGWKLAVTIEESEISSSTFNSFAVMTAIPVSGLLLAALGIFMVIRYLRKIVNKVNNFAELAASGDFSKRIEVTEFDEFGFMEQRLNIMMSNMNDMYNRSVELLEIAKKESQSRYEFQTAALAAQEASRMKSAFLANMSHEIRTPMNGIVGFTELAIESGVPPKAGEYLQKIKISAEGLLQIINDILDISKIEAGKLDLENIPFDLHDIFKTCRNIIEPKAADKGLSLVCYAEPPTDKKLIGDPTRLRQVLLNLLSNAVKFTDVGTVTLTSNILETNEESVTIYFEIKDEGIGMTPEQIGRIFTPFTQADNSITRKYGGTGLGLSITKNIIELMGGELYVKSELGLGSEFSFKLTFQMVDQTDSASMFDNVDNVADEIKKPYFKGEILVCDDNEVNQQVVCDLLALVGIDTVVADNGKKCVDIVAHRIKNGEKPFDLILMDIQMPVMGGIEAADRLAEIGNKTPIVALTANIMSDDRETYREHGMPVCLGKPFKTNELWACLLRYLTPVEREAGEKEPDKKPAGTGFASLAGGIPELDVEWAVAAMGGQESLYEKMFRNIVRFAPQNDALLNDSINSGDLAAFAIQAHKMKGTLNQIGYKLLGDYAGKLEKAAKDGDKSFCDKHYGDFMRQLGDFYCQAEAVISEVDKRDTGEENKSIPYDAIDAYFDELEKVREAAENFDSVLASELLAPLASRRFGGRADELISEIVDALEAYDSEKAVKHISELLEEYK